MCGGLSERSYLKPYDRKASYIIQNIFSTIEINFKHKNHPKKMWDEYYMREALKEAKVALREGNWPIGCVIELDGEIISRAHNEVYTRKDKLAHAEILALSKVQDKLHDKIKSTTLYTTYEPCPMCFGAAILSRVRRIACGIDLNNSGATYLRANLPLLFKKDTFYVELTTGVLADDCAEIFMRSELVKKLNNEGLLRKL